jgi:DMSO/TMAO reductase YedYZ molybdopterin-dependent catalytic subunit
MFGRALFSHRHLAPEFPPEAITPEPRANGGIGRPERLGTTVRVEIPEMPAREYSIAGLLGGVPRSEHITEFKCIEGWSQVVQWGGVRLAEVAAHHGWPVDRFAYLGLATPDGGYYVGLDMPSALHPQTLLCDQMNGEPLAMNHGAPLRLILPVKYGIKNLKWISRIFFASEPPPDYWAERGYDWYAGL